MAFRACQELAVEKNMFPRKAFSMDFQITKFQTSLKFMRALSLDWTYVLEC
jgi:hypothetical protein